MLLYTNVRDNIRSYHTALYTVQQCCTHTRVLGHHSPSAQTPSSVSFNGLELGLKIGLELKRKLE